MSSLRSKRTGRLDPVSQGQVHRHHADAVTTALPTLLAPLAANELSCTNALIVLD